MIPAKNDSLELNKAISRYKKIIREIISFSMDLETATSKDKGMISKNLASLKEEYKKADGVLRMELEKIQFIRPLKKGERTTIKISEEKLKLNKKEIEISKLEKITLRRIIKKKKAIIKKEERGPRLFVRLSNNLFGGISENLVKKYSFSDLERNLIKSGMQFVTSSYISMILFTSLLAFIACFGIIAFLSFFELSILYPFLAPTEQSVSHRVLQYFWMIFLLPGITCLFAYFYPSLKKKSLGAKIDQELPFATIHMAAISASMINPERVFGIIVKTGEYPSIGKVFTRIINEVNVYGINLAGALRNAAYNSPSIKLSELLNGVATTISSGGDFQIFFDKRSQTLFFEHKIESEKSTKIAETFMDIYISMVIAAPMIFMLLLMMMKISGLGFSLSTNMITLIMVSGVSVLNMIFLVFLNLKRPDR